MEYQTQFPSTVIEKAALEDLVTRLANLTGVEFKSTHLYVVETPSSTFSDLLDRVKDELESAAPVKVNVTKRGRKVAEQKGGRKVKTVSNASPAEKQKLGLHSYVFDETGEVVSAQALNKRLGRFEVAFGTRLTNGRGGHFEIVSKGEGLPFVVEKIEDGEKS